MEIEVKQKNRVLFGNIEPGDVFEHSNFYYIKMDRTIRHECACAEYNAVDLSDGEPALFLDTTIVFVPSAKLVIE